MKRLAIEKDRFTVSHWSGGTTTQMFIYPEHAELSLRNFDFRISSASFTTTRSQFSDFSGYTRFILPLRGKLIIRHPGEDPITLLPYEIHRFDGGAKTDSENTPDCIDFNLIVRKDIHAEMAVWDEKDIYPLKKDCIYIFYSEHESRFHLQDANPASNEGVPGFVDSAYADSRFEDSEFEDSRFGDFRFGDFRFENPRFEDSELRDISIKAQTLYLIAPHRDAEIHTSSLPAPVVVCKIRPSNNTPA